MVTFFTPAARNVICANSTDAPTNVPSKAQEDGAPDGGPVTVTESQTCACTDPVNKTLAIANINVNFFIEIVFLAQYKKKAKNRDLSIA